MAEKVCVVGCGTKCVWGPWILRLLSSHPMAQSGCLVAKVSSISAPIYPSPQGEPRGAEPGNKALECSIRISGWWQPKYFWNFHLYLGKMNPFQGGWFNHQPVLNFRFGYFGLLHFVKEFEGV